MKKSAPSKKQKITEAERHKRFVDVAQQTGASETPGDFDAAFARVVKPKSQQTKEWDGDSF